MFKAFVLFVLQIQAKRYLARHQMRLVVVTGSVGKTSTKLAIAAVLGEKYRVRSQMGNYNVDVTVPLVIFDLPLPEHLKNPFSWLGLLLKTESLIHQKNQPVDVIVLELGTDKPGDVSAFGKYLSPDIAVVTAVAAEHMEFFKTMDAVAQEELSVAAYSKLTIINRDDIDENYAKYAYTENIDTYGSGTAEYRFLIEESAPDKPFLGTFIAPEYGELKVVLNLVGEHNAKAAVAAGAVAAKFGLSSEEVVSGMAKIVPAPGRMQMLPGLEHSTIIDDTYNSSPISAIAALQTLYLFQSPQHIAILGSMNELGEMSAQLHEQVGHACDGSLLDWVVTIGDEAEKYLAPAARAKGCPVKSFHSPYEAGAFVRATMHPRAVILVKGSQNGVFAEEAVKLLLHNVKDELRLVRQSPEWLQKKTAQFSAF